MNVHDAIRMRRSVREYSGRPLPDDVMQRMRNALRFAPSACNLQPWRFLFVLDEKLRRDLAQAANGQHWMADAPAIVVACGLPGEAYKKMGGAGNSVDVDVAIAVDHLTLAAVAEGLGTCWIGAFHEGDVKRLLGIPDDAKVVALMPLGSPARPELNHALDNSRRKADEDVFATDGW